MRAPCVVGPPTARAACAARQQSAQERQCSSSAPRAFQHQRRRAPLPPAAAAAGGSDAGPLCVIIECDGALVDAHGEGHRVAFNRAFSVSCWAGAGVWKRGRLPPLAPGERAASAWRPGLAPPASPSLSHALQEFGHDCTNWTPAVFYDLMRLGDGTGAASLHRRMRLLPRVPARRCCRSAVGPLPAHSLPPPPHRLVSESGWCRRGPDRRLLRHPRLAHDAGIQGPPRLPQEAARGQGAAGRAKQEKNQQAPCPGQCFALLSIPKLQQALQLNNPLPCTSRRPQVRILREMAAKGEVPLRQGVQQFIDDALVRGRQRDGSGRQGGAG